MNLELYKNGRVLFIVQKCPYCLIWKEMIDTINCNLPIEKRIRVIDTTLYHDSGIITDPLITAFEKQVNGAYPVLFFEGIKLVGVNTKQELESALNIILEKYYLVPKMEYDSTGQPFKYEKDCKFVNNIFGKRRVVCA